MIAKSVILIARRENPLHEVPCRPDTVSGLLNMEPSKFAQAMLEIAPRAVTNAQKGIDMAIYGMYKDSRGRKVIDTTLTEAASKFLGFQPRSVAEVQETAMLMQRSKSFYQATRSEIQAQMADAIFRRDPKARTAAERRVAEWNRKNPDMRITINWPAVRRRVNEMNKDRLQRMADSAPAAMRAAMRAEIREMQS